jgi:hypothetical protein
MTAPAGAGLEAVAMIPVDGETQRLRELHELYVWQVNAAVEEGRDDLVEQLADEYLEAAVAELAAGRAPLAGTDADHADTADGPAAAVTPVRPVEPTQPDDGPRWEVAECRPGRAPWWRRLRRR